MKDRFRLFRRGWGTYYVEDTETGKQQTLQTTDKREAHRMVHARNEARQTPHVNLMIAKAYLAASDPALTSRTWQDVLNAIIGTKTGDTRHRWETAAKDHAFDPLRNLPLVKTQAEDIFGAINRGTVSTNVYLRRLHNFAWDMNWLLGPVVVRRHWPKIRFKEKRLLQRALDGPGFSGAALVGHNVPRYLEYLGSIRPAALLGAADRDFGLRDFFDQDGGVENPVLLGTGEFFTVDQQHGFVAAIYDHQLRHGPASGNFRHGNVQRRQSFTQSQILKPPILRANQRHDGDILVMLSFSEPN